MRTQASHETRHSRIIIGAAISVATYGLAVPVTFVLLSKWLDQEIGFPPLFGPGLASLLAAAAILIGLLWVTWSYSYIVFFGKGSPVEAFGVALEPTKQLVTSGPYGYMRHPMIFGMLWVILGIGFYMRSLAALILVAVSAIVAWLHIVLWEESGLAARFGQDYIDYRDHVRALIPHLRPYAPERHRKNRQVGAAKS